MSRAVQDHPAESDNPFIARRLRPGVVAFRFSPGAALDDLLARLERSPGRGQIIGPHGSGKSTLVASVIDALQRRGRRVTLVELHRGRRSVPAGVLAAKGERVDWLVVDGYEQLGWLGRWRLGRSCRRCGCGLLVTAHRSVGMPTLWTTSVSPALARQVAAELQRGYAALVADSDVDAALACAGGNLREALFALFDLYAERARGA